MRQISPIAGLCAALLLAAPSLAQQDFLGEDIAEQGAALEEEVLQEEALDEAVLEDVVRQEAKRQETLIDGVAAQVGNDVVLVSEVLELAAPVEERMRAAAVPEAQIVGMRSEVLERLIEARLISEVVHRLELGATSGEIDQAIRGIAAETGLSMRQLADSVTSHGLTFEEYRGKIGAEIERTKVLNNLVRSQVRIEPDEIDALYRERYGNQRSGGEEVRLHYLVVPYGPNLMRNRDTACQMAQDGAARIRDGEFTFDEMARRLSDAGQPGGDMGWVHVDDLAGWMVPVVNRLEPGQMSEVVETRFGCNLLLVQDRRGFQAVSFAQARPQLEQELFRSKSEERYVEWLNELRERTYIERKGMFASSRMPL